MDLALASIPFGDADKVLQQKRQMAKDNGLWAPYLPLSEGGKGLTLTEFAQVSEIMGTSPFGHYVFNCQAPDIGNIELLHKNASPSQRAQYLKPLACLLYTSDAADERSSVDLGGRRIIKK